MHSTKPPIKVNVLCRIPVSPSNRCGRSRPCEQMCLPPAGRTTCIDRNNPRIEIYLYHPSIPHKPQSLTWGQAKVFVDLSPILLNMTIMWKIWSISLSSGSVGADYSDTNHRVECHLLLRDFSGFVRIVVSLHTYLSRVEFPAFIPYNRNVLRIPRSRIK